ncbi:MAG: mandelate racemase/muconate lactonizing enzyme family protein [Thaumarchaeota archaeon]|nr:mandelate racemase/muconate lactonizing enzyme family protein [Nitrososphaerota archaeon]
MKITEVEPIILQIGGARNSDTDMGLIDALVVKVHTDEGIYGVGECDGHPLVISSIIRGSAFPHWGDFEQLLIGENPLNITYLWEKMYNSFANSGRRGLSIWAMSGIDVALWDIAGKYYKRPVYQLLGGAGGKDAVTPYASLNSLGSTPDEVVRTCRESIKKPGYRAAKVHTDPKTLRDGTMAKLVKLAREELGEEIPLMLDLYMALDTDEAIRFARSVEPYNIGFIEAALKPDNLDGYAKLSYSTTIDIAAGEEHTTRFMHTELMDKGKVDIVQADATEAGGITEVKRIAALAHDRGKKYIPHCWKTNISFAANMNVVASTINAPYVEFPIIPGILRNQLTNETFQIDSSGRMKFPENPGLGVTLNEDVVEKYRYGKSPG